jgi:hypothetical protein
MTKEEEDEWLMHWRSLSALDQNDSEKHQPWSVGQWSYWMLPSNRQWFLWKSNIVNHNEAELIIEICDWPVALGALEWLIHAAGGEICGDVKQV